MSKFRRVVETEGLGVVAGTVFGEQTQTDPYAHLRESASDNKIKIAKQQMDGTREAAAPARDWEVIPEQQNYEERRELTLDERIAQLNAADMSINAVRRSSYGIDDGDTAREVTTGLKAYSPEVYASIMMRGGASIFDPDMAAIADEFEKSQKTITEQSIADIQQRRMARKSIHDEWEKEQATLIRKPSVLQHRASSVLRTAVENEAAGNFGMMDQDLIEENEARRVAMAEANRESRLALKSAHVKTRSQVNEDWENNARKSALTMNDVYHSIDLNLDEE
jgi:hypothetical protein